MIDDGWWICPSLQVYSGGFEKVSDQLQSNYKKKKKEGSTGESLNGPPSQFMKHETLNPCNWMWKVKVYLHYLFLS